jgi:hypothetical protein
VTQHAATLKAELARLGALAEVGLRKDPGLAARIRALAQELEPMSPAEEPARAASWLRGRWRLIYATFDLERDTSLARISLGTLPDAPVELVDFYNEIDPAAGLYDRILHMLDADGNPQTLIMAGHYAVEDDRTIDIQVQGMTVAGANGRVTLQGDDARLRNLRTQILYLDEGFRMVRGTLGALYLLERLDPAPLRWARDA